MPMSNLVCGITLSTRPPVYEDEEFDTSGITLVEFESEPGEFVHFDEITLVEFESAPALVHFDSGLEYIEIPPSEPDPAPIHFN